MPTESYVRKRSGKLKSGARDVRKGLERSGDIRKMDHAGNRYRLILGLENQSGVDNTMPQRVMGYDYSSYEEQIKEIMDRNRKENRPAVTKRIHDDQKLAPVVTLVLYYGKDEWKTPRCLHDMLEFPEEIEECVKPLVADYPMNLIRVGGLSEEERARLKSDFRLVAEYVARGNNEEKLDQFFRENRQEIRHEEEFLDIMGELTGKKYHREILKTIKEEKGTEGGGIRMFDLITKYEEKGRLKGKEEGKREGKKEGRRDNRDNHVSKEMIIQKLIKLFEISGEEAEKYYDRAVQKEAKNCYNQVNEKD